MNKSTEAQIKEFWEWCGFEWSDEYSVISHGHWSTPDKGVLFELPPIDLNNLFKYAVPKLPLNRALSLTKYGDRPNYYARIQGFYAEDKPIVKAEDNPALALFWAIWEVIHAKQ